jgi:hypothetical protein
MTKIECVINENNTNPYSGIAILDNCKFTLTKGFLSITGKGLKLINGSCIETTEDAVIEVANEEKQGAN